MWWLLACTTAIEADDLCQEVGYAIASRTQTCTGDAEAAEARYTRFEEDYTCVEVDPSDTGGVRAEDLYACPLALRNLACELVVDYGDDLDAWLGTSPVCELLVEAP